jgi:ectoine hydroxylase-related dioxygenase (phytanoyl-CoA dioxygenase family)
MSKVQTYGVTQRREAHSDLDLNVEELERIGFTSIQGVLSDRQCDELSLELEKIYNLQIEEIGSEKLIENIGDKNNVRAPLLYSEQFKNLALNPTLLEFARRLLGQNFVLLMQNGVKTEPSKRQFQAQWHRDLNYQHWTSSKPLAINALFVLDEYSLENGCTHVLPGSHLHAEFPSEAFTLKHEFPAILPRGSLLILNAMTYHRAGLNTGKNVRRAVNHVLGIPMLAQQIDLSSLCAGSKHDVFEENYFGKTWSPASNAKTWRSKRIQ